MPQNIYTLQDVSFAYNGDKTVFKGISLEIEKNDLIVIRGESGAGKSTFLKLFNRFCDCTGGEIRYHGKSLYDYRIDAVRSSAVYFPQLPVVIEGTINDNLSFPFHFHSHKGKKYDPARAREWLDYFQLDVPLDHDALKLSVGQKQRVALIRSMLLEPEVLLMDEPGSALDSTNIMLIEQKIESLIESSGITVLMATHNDVSFSGTDVRTFTIKDGNLKAAG